MEIVYVSNDAYTRHLGVSVYSLYDRCQDEPEVNVTVISTGITDESKEKLDLIAREFGRKITYAGLSDLRERFDFEVNTGRFDISTLGRFFAGDLLPVTVPRAIYLDCDTVVLHSLKRLWETDLKGKLLGAVQEPTIYPEVKENLGLAAAEPYFNAGVLVMDLTKWRAEKIRKKLIAYYGTVSAKCLFNDQDALNGFLKGRIRNLSPVWNFFTNYRYYHYRDLTAMSPAYRVIPEQAFERAKSHPAIVHFAGDERPWKAGSLNHYGAAYRMYLALTPWNGTRPERGSKLKMTAYHLMDWLTWFFPEGRKRISRMYFRKIAKEREAHG